MRNLGESYIPDFINEEKNFTSKAIKNIERYPRVAWHLKEKIPLI